jgi:hypothetical protein
MDITKHLFVDRIGLDDCGISKGQDLVVRLATEGKESMGLIVAFVGPVDDPDSEAYARLFAAAPDLLAVCKIITEARVESAEEFIIISLTHQEWQQLRKAIARVDEAIAKGQ